MTNKILKIQQKYTSAISDAADNANMACVKKLSVAFIEEL